MKLIALAAILALTACNHVPTGKDHTDTGEYDFPPRSYFEAARDWLDGK